MIPQDAFTAKEVEGEKRRYKRNRRFSVAQGDLSCVLYG